jgi:hypothetical protein
MLIIDEMNKELIHKLLITEVYTFNNCSEIDQILVNVMTIQFM